MLMDTFKWSAGKQSSVPAVAFSPDLIQFFCSRSALEDGTVYDRLHDQYDSTTILGCSTGGQIFRDDILDDEICAAALKFATTRIALQTVQIASPGESRTCGTQLAQALSGDGLAAVFVLSDGLNVNGSQLVAGLTDHLPDGCSVSGGLAADGAQFERTLVSANGRPTSGLIAAVGFYGPDIRVAYGCSGGWDVFGPKRRVTKCDGNVLYELDGEPALDLYERYLGPEEAKRLPSSALLYPLQCVDPSDPKHTLVRTVLAVDHDRRSMTFAGDFAPDSIVQLMRGNLDHVASAGAEAGEQARVKGTSENALSILVSCIGRRLTLGQRTVDEVDACLGTLKTPSTTIGFYSYGEIAPHPTTGRCDLHNETMTVTTIAEG